MTIDPLKPMEHEDYSAVVNRMAKLAVLEQRTPLEASELEIYRSILDLDSKKCAHLMLNVDSGELLKNNNLCE